MTAGQLALDLGTRPAFGMEDFVVGPCNEAAVGWLDRWPRWPGPALVIHGPPGCGKTHLAHVFRARTRARAIAARDLTAAGARRLTEATGAVVLDDVDRAFEGEARLDEAALLHLHNALAESGGHLLLTARTAPSRWATVLPDLASRLRAAPAVAVTAPDDTLMAAVLVKLFADRQLRVGREVVEFLVRRMERSFEAARDMVAAIDEGALAAHRKVTVPFVREALGDGGFDT
jgi:DnaA regulatory inactivator Hda